MYQTNDRVIERNVGNFAGWPLANDWGVEIQHCCTGNASRSIYFIWDHILDYSSGKLRVDLLLNRASPWADIDSHIPYTGRVDIRIKTPVRPLRPHPGVGFPRRHPLRGLRRDPRNRLQRSATPTSAPSSPATS